jgi:hypothetical protein
VIIVHEEGRPAHFVFVCASLLEVLLHSLRVSFAFLGSVELIGGQQADFSRGRGAAWGGLCAERNGQREGLQRGLEQRKVLANDLRPQRVLEREKFQHLVMRLLIVLSGVLETLLSELQHLRDREWQRAALGSEL